MAKNIKTTNKKEAAEVLSKLLDAADRARSQGKYLALGKLLHEAKKISKKIKNDIDDVRSEEDPRASIYTDFFKKFREEKVLQKAPQYKYKKVVGELVE